MSDTTQQPTDQFDPVDPLELEDEVTPDEEVGDFAHVETPEEEVREEQDLVKAIDEIVIPLDEDLPHPDQAMTDASVSTKSRPQTKASATSSPKKAPSYMVPRELIDSDLDVTKDLFDDGYL